MLAQRAGVAEGDVGVEVQPELGELDADLGVQAAGRDLVEQRVVVVGHLLCFAQVGQVLPQPSEEQADAVRSEWLSGAERLVGALAWHESAHRSARKRKARKVLLEPSVPGHPEQDVAHVSPSRGDALGAANLPRRSGADGQRAS